MFTEVDIGEGWANNEPPSQNYKVVVYMMVDL